MRTPVLLVLLAAAAAAPPAPEPVVETLHGHRIVDRFRHLETEDGAKDFIARENERTRKALAKVDRAPIAKRLDELSRVGWVGRAMVAGGATFFLRRAGAEEQSALYVRTASGGDRRLVDPSSLDQEGKLSLDWYWPSRSGKLVAYGLSRDGSEESTLHVLEAASGQDLVDRIPQTRASSVAWLPDESGFYYTRYPVGDRYNRHVYLHRLGEEPSKDSYVFGRQLPRTDWTDLVMAEDGQHLFLLVSKGWSQSELWMLDRRPNTLTRVLGQELGALFRDPLWLGGRIVVRTNHAAPRFRVVSVDPAQPAPDRWQQLIAEGEHPLQRLVGVGGRLAVERLEKAISRLALHDAKGRPLAEVPLPELGSIVGMDAALDGDRLVMELSSFLRPPAILQLPAAGGAVDELVVLPERPDVSDLVVEQLEAGSYDGTGVPVFLIHRRGLARDGNALTLVYGYGGFNVSVTPLFNPNAIFLAERGGVYAVAVLRGGGELGEEWHRAGKQQLKHQVFRDFEHVMRHLVHEGFTRPQRLAITGASNGGLLVGAMMTQAPELFRAAVGKVGLYDMIRYQRFPPAELWVDEYGSSEDPRQLGYLYAYSPYHQVVDGVAYPAFLGLTARADTRVSWVHTAKFVARLQQATSGKAPILFHRDERTGHGKGKGRTDRLEEDVRTWQFILGQLGPLPEPRRSP